MIKRKTKKTQKELLLRKKLREIRKKEKKKEQSEDRHEEARVSSKSFAVNKTRKGKYKTGVFWSTKMNTTYIFRSGYELAFFHILEADSEVVNYIVEPFSIPYRIHGRTHRYFPDIIVFYKDNSSEIIEIKPRALRYIPVVQAKASAAKEYIKKKMVTSNCTYRFVFEDDIFKTPDCYKKFLKIVNESNR